MAAGPFTVSTLTRTETPVETIETILAELGRMKRAGITEKELKDARARYIGGWPLGLETPDQITGKILDTELYGLGEDYLVRYTGLLDAVTLEEFDQLPIAFPDRAGRGGSPAVPLPHFPARKRHVVRAPAAG